MANIEINITDNGTTTLATAGKYCDKNVDVVVNVAGGGGGEELPEEALVVSGDCSYKFVGGWDWFINSYGDKITTQNINSTMNMFYNCQVENIPFDINTNKYLTTCASMFYNCGKLKSAPYIIGPERALPTTSYGGIIFQHMFYQCYRLKEIPYDYFWKIVPNKDYWEADSKITTQSRNGIFNYCYSLREHPDISMLGGAWTSAYSSLYTNLFYNCYVLNKIENLPVCGEFTSNVFSYTFSNCNKAKDITFAVNEDGTPKTAQWKSQTIDLSSTNKIGYCYSQSAMTSYNSGLTSETRIDTADEWEELKDNPDAWTSNASYSRYNHDSAVRTINSLPDTSAYLATAGGTNTIKFSSTQGNGTKNADGTNGAISNLTEEEIAVATAKGWTVTLV